MNVLFLTSAFPCKEYPKSNAHNLRSILNLTKRPPIEIQVIHLRSWKPWRGIYLKSKINGLNVASYSFPYYSFLPKPILGIFLTIYKKVLYHYFLKTNMSGIDIIHTAGVSMESVVGSYISKKTGIKHIAQCMGSDVNFGLPKLSKTIGWKGYEKNVDIFCCNSLSLQNELIKIFPLAKTTVIYRGVNLDEFCFNPLKQIKPHTDTLKFLYLGGLQTNNKKDKYNSKGGVTLLKSWIKLFYENYKATDEVKIELVFAGPNVRNEIVTEIVNENPVNLCIKVVGQLAIQDVKKYIINSSAVILPSITEGLPNVAMEAAAIGRAVIGSNVGGIPEIIINEVTGFIFNVGNLDELCKLINSYRKDPDLLYLHGANARKYVESNFDSTMFTQNYLKVYNCLSSK